MKRVEEKTEAYKLGRLRECISERMRVRKRVRIVEKERKKDRKTEREFFLSIYEFNYLFSGVLISVNVHFHLFSTFMNSIIFHMKNS